MRIATRLTFALIAILSTLVAAHALWNTRSAVARVDADLRADMVSSGKLLGATLGAVMERYGAARAQRVVAEAAGRLPDRSLDWIASSKTPPDGFTGTAAQWQTLTERGQPLFATPQRDALDRYVPISGKDGVGAVVRIRRTSERQRIELRAVLINHLVLAVLVILLVALAVNIAVRRFVGDPLHALGEAADRIGGGDFTGRVVLRRDDEVGQFARRMNDMAERLEATRLALDVEVHRRISVMAELRHAERLKTVGQLASGAAHELGTPLNVIIGRARMIARGMVKGDDLVESAEIIVAQGDRMTGLIRNLLTFARRRPSPEAAIVVGEVVRESLALLEPLLDKRGVEVQTEIPDAPLGIRGDAGQLEQVLANMLMNAAQAMPNGGTVRVELSRASLAPSAATAGGREGEFVRITVRDEGVGMDDPTVARIFEPFFTTKSVGEGTGLGLSIVYGIVRDHAGWIDVESRPGDGSVFHIYLPVDAGA